MSFERVVDVKECRRVLRVGETVCAKEWKGVRGEGREERGEDLAQIPNYGAALALCLGQGRAGVADAPRVRTDELLWVKSQIQCDYWLVIARLTHASG